MYSLSKVSETFCFWQWKVLEIFQTYRFRKSGLKEKTFRKEKAAENRIGLKEYTLIVSIGTPMYQQLSEDILMHP